MRNRLALILVAALALVANSSHAAALTLDKLVGAYASQRGFNGVVLVARQGKVVYQGAFGLAQQAWQVPSNADAIFRIGSLSKPFTATLVMQLAAKGKIDLDGTLGQYLPALYADSDAKHVTVRQLLSHTSGLADVPGRYTDPFWQNEAQRSYEPQQFARQWIPGKLAGNQGSWRYNNNGYFLLGLIVERATGKSYVENLRESIFAPAGMTDSGLYDSRTLLPKLAEGYARGDDGTRERPLYIDPSVSYAAAGLYSTAADLLRFDQALANGRLLGSAQQREMFTDRGSQYGYGWGVEDWAVQAAQPLPVALHTGSVPGYQSMLVRSLSDGDTIIVLNNYWQGATVVAMTRDIFDLMHGKSVALPRLSLEEALTPVLYHQGLEAMRAAYEEIRARRPSEYELGESALNNLGYTFLRKSRTAAAVQVFRWNVQAHPNSPNVYDSLAEGLLSAGDREGARANYAKVLTLDPGNRHAATELEKLAPVSP